MRLWQGERDGNGLRMKTMRCAIPLDESSVIYAATGATVAAVAVIGSRAVAPDSRWYRSLHKPSWQPPSRAFGAVWSPLYVSIAWAGGHALSNSPWRARRGLAISLGANLTLNAAWSWMFFGLRSPQAGLLATVLLDVSNLELLHRTARTDPPAALALLPYATWCAFATALSSSIARRNPSR